MPRMCLCVLHNLSDRCMSVRNCRYPGIGARMPATILSQRIAVTSSVASLIRSLCVTGSNPTALAKVFAECKGREFDRRRVALYGDAVTARAQTAAGTSDQHTLGAAFRAASKLLPVVTEDTWGVVMPGHALVRTFFRLTYLVNEDYQFAFREQHVWGEVVCGDHTLKLLKSQRVSGHKVLTYRFTLWSNDLNCPLLVVNTTTGSYDDPALIAAFEELNKVLDREGHPKIVLAYIDNVRRDLQGILRRLPSLSCSVDATVATGASAASVASAADLPRPVCDDDKDVDGEEGENLDPSGDSVNAVADADEEATPESHLANGASPSGVDAENAHAALLEAAIVFLNKFATSRRAALKGMDSIEFPTCLRSEDREKLHDIAGELGLEHKSHGTGGNRRLVVSWPSAGGTSSIDAVRPSDGQEPIGKLKFNDLWRHVRCKADVVHWMRNIFKIAHSKGSGLYKYWCTALSDAVFMVCVQCTCCFVDAFV